MGRGERFRVPRDLGYTVGGAAADVMSNTPINLVKPPLGRVSLDKGGQASISLDKADRELVVTATLEWDGGSAKRRRQGADLDLYALFVPQGTPVVTKTTRTSTSKKKPTASAVYYKRLGSLERSPYLRLAGDSRVPGAETIQIKRPDRQGYVLLCAYSAVGNGVGSFRSFGAHVVITDHQGSTVTVPLFEDTRTRYWVAIALVDFTDPDGVAIRHIEEYSSRFTEKRPVLHIDGTIEMNAGPVEFKRR